jgi:hypothetical protein
MFGAFANSAAPILEDGINTYVDAGNLSSYPTTGAVWGDLSGLARNATLINTPTYNSSFNGVLDFNGSTQYATMGALPATFFQGSWTFQCWVKFDNVSERCLLSAGTTSNNNGLHLIVRSGDWIFGMFNNDMVISTPDPVTGVWYFTTWTYNNTSPFVKQFYIDNAFIQAGNGNAYGGSGNNELGRIGWGGFNGYYFDGMMGLALIYNRVLTPSEINQNYQATKNRYGFY